MSKRNVYSRLLSLRKTASGKRLNQAVTSFELLELRRLLSGTWTTLANQAPGEVGTMELLPNGSVLATIDGDGAGNDWGILTPVNGSYVNGTWSLAAKANNSRLFDATDVLQNGSVFVAGGEDGNGDGTGEVYNPITNTWTLAPSQPYGNFSDALSTLIPNGDVLITPVSPDINAGSTFYNPTTNTWSQGPQLPYSFDADEQSGVTLPDGSFLTVYNNESERYLPTKNKWVTDANLPASLSDGLGEYGDATLLPNGKALFIGAGGNTALYTPSGSATNGSWVAGPSIPGGLGEDDSAAAMLRDGTLLITAGPADSYNGPTTLYSYNYSSNAFTAASGPNTYSGPPFLIRMLDLPNGDLLYSENGTTLYQYDPGTTALASAVPTITSIVHNTNGSMTLTGTNLNGLSAGATYGDDAQMNTNYPLVRLTSGSNTYYATTSNWSSTGVMLGSASESVNFTLPLGIPAGTYSLVAVANGVPSSATQLVVSTTSPNSPPTIATAPSVSPTTVTGTTAALSVLGADDGGASNLTYTWTNVSAPAGQPLASFSVNGTNSAANATAIFHEIGSYTFNVTITDAGGLSVTSGTVSVVVNQTLGGVTVSPTPVELSAGQTKQLTATGYDQFGNLMNSQPVFNWSVTSGSGTVSPGGIYSAPATGTLATVSAAAGSFIGSSTISVVNIPWTATDIGNVSTPGESYNTGTTTTLFNSSDDIWNQSDDFQFDYQELSGNVTITAELNSQTSASGYIKAGLMIRNSLAANSSMGMISDPAPGPDFEWRTSTNSTAAQDASSSANNAPYWLQLSLNNGTLTGSASPDGINWTQIGTQAITIGTNVYVGLALTSHDTGATATAVFSNVSISSSQTLSSVKVLSTPVNLTAGHSQQLIAEGFDQNGFLMSTQPSFTWAVNSGSGTISSAGFYTAPSTGTLATVTASSGGFSAPGTVAVVNSPWVSTDIGVVNAPGTAYDSGSSTTLTDTSDDIWNQSDDFHFDYQTITGNGSITAELNSQTSVSSYIKAGVMMRNSLAADDVMAMMSDPAPAPDFEWRTSPSVSSAQDTGPTAENTPYWVRLVRSGSLFSGYISPNGTTWTLIGSQTLTMNSTIYVGLALTSHDTSNLATAVFSNVSISNPSVVIAAAASPSPATGKTASLSVLGANANNSNGESSLTYTWATTASPSGSTTSFNFNGSNAAKNTTVSFSKTGSYTFTVTIADALGSTVTSAVTLVVNQTLTSIVVTPASVTVNENQLKPFSAVGYDQFGVALSAQPTITWSKTTGVGSIDSGSGIYTAPSSPGSATIAASSGSVSGSANITVSNAAPTIVNPAAASPSPVTGTTTALSVLGSDDNGESNLIYSWQTTSGPANAPAPMFSLNGSNGAKNTTATFYEAGNYNFTATLTDAQGATATSSVSVTVNQTLTAVTLSSATVGVGGTTQATANDQFNAALTVPPTWSATGGTISGSGNFTAGNTGGNFTITATVGTLSVTAGVTVVTDSFTGSPGSDFYAIRLSPGNSTLEQIFVNTPESSAPTYTVPLSQLPSLSFTTASDGLLTIDFANGNPLPGGGVSFTGGSKLSIAGSAAGGMAFSINSSNVIDSAAASSPIAYTNVQSVEFDLAGGSNTLAQTAQPAATLTYNAGPLNNTLNVSGGFFNISSDPAIASGNLTVNDFASLTFSPATPGSVYSVRNLAALNIAAGATATVSASTTSTDRTVLETGTLSITSGGTLNLTSNAMIVHSGDLAGITTLITSGYNAGGGYWNGTGIISSIAASDTTFLTDLGVMSNNNSGAALYSSFDNQAVLATDVLVKYTYAGDANLDGLVDGSDYSRIDNGFLSGATGWFNGDFNYDRTVNGSDYTLIDNAYNVQHGTIPHQPATAAVAATSPVTRANPKKSATKAILGDANAPLTPQSVFATQDPIWLDPSLTGNPSLVLNSDLLDKLAARSFTAWGAGR